MWKLTSSAKIWYPIEVAEDKITVSGGRQSGQGPGVGSKIQISAIVKIKIFYWYIPPKVIGLDKKLIKFEC